MKKTYSTPKIRSEHVELGVFGSYGALWTAQGFATWLASWGFCCQNDPDWWDPSWKL